MKRSVFQSINLIRGLLIVWVMLTMGSGLLALEVSDGCWYLVIAYSLVAVAAVVIRTSDGERLALMNSIFLVVDIAAIATLGFLTSGIFSSYFILYLFPLINASLTYGRMGSLAVVGAMVGIYVLAFRFTDWPLQQIRNLFIDLGLMAVLALFVGYVGTQLKEEEERTRLVGALEHAHHDLRDRAVAMAGVLAELSKLHEFSYRMAQSEDMIDVLDALVEKIQAILAMNEVLVLLSDEDGLQVRAASRSLRELTGSREWADDMSSEAWVMNLHEPLVQLEIETPAKLPQLVKERHAHPMVASLPLAVSGEIIGVVNVYGERNERLNDRMVMQTVMTTLGLAASSIQNVQMLEGMKATYINVIQSMALALDAKDQYTNGHAERVRRYAVAAAERFGLTAKETEWLGIAATMHDLGKIGIEDRVLTKDRKLSDEEYAIVKKHTRVGVHILEPLEFIAPALPHVLYHHERWDGKGYPEGLKGDAIPRAAQLLAVADTFDAMTSNRSYRAALATPTAIKEIEKNAGIQFSPDAAAAFVATLNEDQDLRDEIERRYAVWKQMWELNQQSGTA